jgi:hypothetical protein
MALMQQQQSSTTTTTAMMIPVLLFLGSSLGVTGISDIISSPYNLCNVSRKDQRVGELHNQTQGVNQ